MTKKNIYRFLLILAVIITLVASVYAVASGRRYFSGRSLRKIGTEVKTFGFWTPAVIFSLIVLSAVIPPLPIPTSFLEITAGIVYGFWPGVILIWISQIVSAVVCFLLSKKVGQIFIGRISKMAIFNFFRQFIEKQGALAVFVLRATMSSPFNLSYFAGLMQMDFKKFSFATALGVIPEVTFFVFLGTLINAHIRFRLWYVFIGLLALNYLPTLIALAYNSLHRQKS